MSLAVHLPAEKKQNYTERAEQYRDNTEFNARSEAQKPVKGEAVNCLDLMDKTRPQKSVSIDSTMGP